MTLRTNYAQLTHGQIRLTTYDIDKTSDIERVTGWIDETHGQAYYQIGDELLMSGYDYDAEAGEYDVTDYDRVQLLNSRSAITDDEFISLFCRMEKMSLHTFLRKYYDRKLDYNLRLDGLL